MADDSFIRIPPDVANPEVLRRTLLRLVEQLDVAFGLRGGPRFSTIAETNSVSSQAQQIQVLLSEEAAALYVRLDGGVEITAPLKYAANETFTDDKELIAKKYADDNFTNNPQGTDPGDLSQTITGPSVAEVQAISDKVDAILAELRVASII